VGRTLKAWIISVSLLAMGIFFLGTFDSKDSQKVKTVEEYWQETGLRSSDLEELLLPELCNSSERYFLSCANAVVSVAQRFGVQAEIYAGVPVSAVPHSLDVSEKVQLTAWKKYFQDERRRRGKVSVLFNATWKKMMALNLDKNREAYLVSVGVNGFLSVFKDPHTYITPMKFYQEVVSQPEAQSMALGIVLGISKEGHYLKKVHPDSISQSVGLKKGDRILAIDSKDVKSLSASQVIELLKSEPSQEIKITILRGTETLNFNLVRKLTSVNAVTSQMLAGTRRLGLVTINKFARESCKIVREQVESLSRQGAEGLLMDLRDNPGGLIDEAACVASLFLGSEKMFVLKYFDRHKDEEEFYGHEERIFEGPVAVLINAGTASSAELLAGILKDYNRAVLVGERSFGKGSFQEGDRWFKNPRIALFQTQGLFYLPSGVSPQSHGVSPDVAVHRRTFLQEREDELFMYPLKVKAPSMISEKATVSLNGNLSLNLKKCLGLQGHSKTDDLEIAQAQSTLSCELLGKTQARVLDVEGKYDSDRAF